MRICETERLAIRTLSLDDLPELTEILSDPEVMEYSVRGVCDEAATRTFIEWCMACYESHGVGPWVLVDKKNSALVGFFDVGPEIVDGVEEINLGYRLATRYWNQGLASDAAKAVLEYTFSQMQLDSVVFVIEPEHVASLKVAEKAGFDTFEVIEFHGRPVRLYRPFREALDTGMAEVIEEVARAILNVQRPFVTRVAIDGVDGAGKTMFGDELGRTLEALGATVIRASVDGFHNPRSVRYRRGQFSPEGFYRDSYDYKTLKQTLLDPLSPGGSGQYIPAVFDHQADTPIHLSLRQAVAGDILIFDGIFAHRPELRGYWDFSVFLEVSFETSIKRLGARDGMPKDPFAPLNRRYIEGQQLYFEECGPADLATVVVDNNELASPCICSTVTETEAPL